jgi:hypothetical protein
MIRRPVASRNVSSVGWTAESEESKTGTLEVEFIGGRIYQYADVPESEYQALIGSSSVGKYLNANIIDTFEASRVK